MGDDLFSLAAARAARDVGIERVAKSAANCELINAAFDVLCDLIREQPTITSDDVWRVLQSQGMPSGNKKALGVVFKDARRAGLIEPTERFVTSERAVAHGHPIRVWASKRFEERVSR